jgi:hypothetical protein
MANDPAMINKQRTNENNTDVDRWADARQAADQWKRMFAIATAQWHREWMSKGMWWTRYALALDD